MGKKNIDMPFRMRIVEIPFLADWFVISMRWLILLGMLIATALARQFTPPALAALLLAVVWNIFVSLLAILNRRLPGHRIINLAVDWCVTLLVFFATDGLRGPVLWAGMLTLLPGAIYYGMKGSLITSCLYFIVQMYWTLSTLWPSLNAQSSFTRPAGLILQFSAVLLVLNLSIGFLIGLAGSALIKALRRTYQDQINVLTENEHKAKQEEHERMQAFYRLLEKLGATLNHQVVLDTTLELSANALGETGSTPSRMVGAVLLFSEGDIRVGAARKLFPADLRVTFPGARGELHAIIETGETRLIQQPAMDPELGRLAALQECASALALPLRRGLSSFGVVLFAHPDKDFFNPERCEVLEVISHQAVIAMQNARLYQDLQGEKERIIESQDEARKRLARDLHDGPTQSVAAVAMSISIGRRLLQRNQAKAEEELARAEDLARRTVHEIRHMLFTLRPLVLESEGLVAALQAMADKMRDTYQQNVLVETDPAVEDPMDKGKQTVVFYLAEEAVNNARKHACASQITVRMNFLPKDNEVALLEVLDDGIGFDMTSVTNAYERRGSLGMVNLRERTELINGVLNIESSPGRGTCVSVLIPLSDTAADRLQRGLVAVV